MNRSGATAGSIGLILQDFTTGDAVIAIGTEGIHEWMQDGNSCSARPFLVGAGLTEDGFTAVYRSFRPIRLQVHRPSSKPSGPRWRKPVKTLSIRGDSLGGRWRAARRSTWWRTTEFTDPMVYRMRAADR